MTVKLPSVLDMLAMFVDHYEGDCSFDHHGFCQGHGVADLDGRCGVVVARQVLAVAIADGKALVEPAEYLGKDEKVSLADLWHSIDADKFGVLQEVAVKAVSPSRADRVAARRIVESVVYDQMTREEQ